jgi:hypothetical protein
MHMGSGHPHHSTLHGWLGSLGQRVLGLQDDLGDVLPASVLVAETAKHRDGQVTCLWDQRYAVAEAKYRSHSRQEQLEGCARLFAVARRLFAEASHPFCEWEQWLESRLYVSAWSFRARARCTAFQQPFPDGSGVESGNRTATPSKQRKDGNHAARSPP